MARRVRHRRDHRQGGGFVTEPAEEGRASGRGLASCRSRLLRGPAALAGVCLLARTGPARSRANLCQGCRPRGRHGALRDDVDDLEAGPEQARLVEDGGRTNAASWPSQGKDLRRGPTPASRPRHACAMPMAKKPLWSCVTVATGSRPPAPSRGARALRRRPWSNFAAYSPDAAMQGSCACCRPQREQPLRTTCER